MTDGVYSLLNVFISISVPPESPGCLENHSKSILEHKCKEPETELLKLDLWMVGILDEADSHPDTLRNCHY